MKESKWELQKSRLEQHFADAGADLMMHLGGVAAVVEIPGGTSAQVVGVGTAQEIIELLVIERLETLGIP